MTDPIIRSCHRCGVEFEPVKPWQRFCSTRCRHNTAARSRTVDLQSMRRVLLAALKNLPEVEIALTASGHLNEAAAASALKKLRAVLKSAERAVR